MSVNTRVTVPDGCSGPGVSEGDTWLLSQPGEPAAYPSAHPSDRIADRPWIASRPAAGVDLGQEAPEVVVEAIGILDIDGVAAVHHDRQGGGRDGLLQEQRRLEAGPVLVAGQDQGWQAERPHLVREVVQRRSLALDAQLGIARAHGRVLGQPGPEVLEAAR